LILAHLNGRDLLQAEVNNLLEQIFGNGVIERNTNGPFGEAIVLEVVFEGLDH